VLCGGVNQAGWPSGRQGVGFARVIVARDGCFLFGRWALVVGGIDHGMTPVEFSWLAEMVGKSVDGANWAGERTLRSLVCVPNKGLDHDMAAFGRACAVRFGFALSAISRSIVCQDSKSCDCE
jgi:hypothetical protein